MSGPKAIEYTLADALLDAAWQAYQSARQRRQEAAQRARLAADARERERHALAQRREQEQQAREEARARAEQAQALMQIARGRQRRLDQARQLADEVNRRHPGLSLEVPGLPPPADLHDPGAVQDYVQRIDAAIRAVEAAVREHSVRAAGVQGMQELLGALGHAVGGEPRSAADQLALYAEQVRALARPAAAAAAQRRTTAERILGRLASLAEGEVPVEVDTLMRRLIEAESEDRAEMLALELRAQVQRFNDERVRQSAVAAENRRREIAGVLVAEVLSDLGYEVDPIAETLFVSGGIAHFQRAEWGDYYVRMRVDPVTSSINVNMVRASPSPDPPDAAQRRRDEQMEAAWCAGMPRLLAELAARGIDAHKLRELDPGAVPVQVVKPETIGDALRLRTANVRTGTAPAAKARPLEQ